LSWFVVQIWFKLYLNLIGAFMLLKEQVISRPRKLPEYPDQEGKVVVITGGGRGIGEEAVKKFVSLGASVVLGCRDREGVQAKFDKMLGERIVRVFSLDLMDMASVRSFAEEVLALDEDIAVLLNNAGIMFGPRKETQEGYEAQLCTNYLGHFLLSHLLLPKLMKTGTSEQESRIVNVSSIAHYLGFWLDMSDINLKQMYSPELSYGNSKVAQVMFTKSLSRKLEEKKADVRVYSLHPGVVYTDLYTHVSLFKFFSWIMKLVMKTPSQGGDTLVHAALDPSLPPSGAYMENCRPARSSSFSRDTRAQQKLWELTCSILNIRDFGGL